MKVIATVKSAISRRWLPLRIAAALIAFAMIAWLLWGAVDLLGNPISYAAAKSNAEKYIAENYADKGYVLGGISYNFKFKVYTAAAAIPDSEDCIFGLYYNSKGEFSGDDYEKRVTGGINTRMRLENRYRELADSVLKSPAFPYPSDNAGGELIFKEFYEEYDFGLPQSILVPDKIYNIAELGEQSGLLTVYVDTENLTDEYAAEVLLSIKSLAEQGGLTFYALDLALESSDGEYYRLGLVRSADIYEDGLVERVKDYHQKETARIEEFENMSKEEYEKRYNEQS